MDAVDQITSRIISAAIRIHSKLGPALLESVYETVLARDLVRDGLKVERQKWISFEFEGLWFQDALRADLVVEGCVVVEIKSVAAVAPVHLKQLLTYLRLMDIRFGLLLNFGAPLMKDGIKRVVNGY